MDGLHVRSVSLLLLASSFQPRHSKGFRDGICALSPCELVLIVAIAGDFPVLGVSKYALNVSGLFTTDLPVPMTPSFLQPVATRSRERSNGLLTGSGATCRWLQHVRSTLDRPRRLALGNISPLHRGTRNQRYRDCRRIQS